MLNGNTRRRVGGHRSELPGPFGRSDESKRRPGWSQRIPWRMVGFLTLFATGYVVMWSRFINSISDPNLVQGFDGSSSNNDKKQVPSTFELEELQDTEDDRGLPNWRNQPGDLSEIQMVKQRWVTDHHVTIANTEVFESFKGYLIDGSEDQSSFSSRTDFLVLVLVGYGEFTETPIYRGTHNENNPLTIPELDCTFTWKDGGMDPITKRAHVNVNGTAFENIFPTNQIPKYYGEKTVTIACPLGPLKDFQSGPYGSLAGTVRVTTLDKSFDTFEVDTFWFVTPNQVMEQYKLTLCSAAAFHMSGSRWITEWIEYHLQLGFDHIHIYLWRNGVTKGDAMWEVINRYVELGVVTAHDWSKIPENPRLITRKKVHYLNWEHGQRLTRNDCFFRNRVVSRYVAFSDVDEMWSLGEEDDLILAWESFGKDVISPPRIKPTDRWISYFEKEYRKSNYMYHGFLMKSVTVPPISTKEIAKREGGVVLDWQARPMGLNRDHGLLIGDMQIAESKCETPYNCGKFHRGRQKYIWRTAFGSINVNEPLFYHAVNENYKLIAATLMTQVPQNMGYLRHYAGHFKHSRMGGLPASKRVHRPISPFLLRRVATSIVRDDVLRKWYQNSPKEKFLGLTKIEDLTRFHKKEDELENLMAENAKLLEETRTKARSTRTRFMTFELFGGRLNNQLLTYDWAFRIALAFDRTLVIPEPGKVEHFIGWPESHAEELHHTSLWNMTELRRRFNFLMPYEIDAAQHSILMKKTEDLPSECVWKYALTTSKPDWKNLASWTKKFSKAPQCEGRIHFQTHDGLVHPYRTDTRRYGVGPLEFWSRMQPSGYLHKVSSEYLREAFGNQRYTLGIHTRSHNSYGPDNVEKAMRSCIRLTEKPLSHAKKYQETRQTCCRPKGNVYPDPTFSWPSQSDDLRALFEERKMHDMCNISTSTVAYALEFATMRLEEEPAIFLATDHENKVVDDLVYSKGGKSFQFAYEALVKQNPLWQQYPGEGSTSRMQQKHRHYIMAPLIDMLILSKTDVFFGNPGSTLSQVVCAWRMSKVHFQLGVELSNICGLTLFATGANDCSKIKC